MMARPSLHAPSSHRVVIAVAVFFAVLLLGQRFATHTFVYTHIFSARVIDPISAIGKLASQLVGCVYAARCVSHYEKGSAIRRAWALMSVWLGAFLVGQMCLSFYRVVLAHDPPLPSIGDAFFFSAYAAVIAAIVFFISAYRASGFPVGRIREHVFVALGACAIFGIIGYRVLLPIAMADTPVLERFVNVGYPMCDLVLLIPTVVLLRITSRFRGGRIWTVWASLLFGIILFTAGDIAFADVATANALFIAPIVDLLFILGYLFSAYGAVLQWRLLTETS